MDWETPGRAGIPGLLALVIAWGMPLSVGASTVLEFAQLFGEFEQT
jgi:hypothetical protein